MIFYLRTREESHSYWLLDSLRKDLSFERNPIFLALLDKKLHWIENDMSESDSAEYAVQSERMALSVSLCILMLKIDNYVSFFKDFSTVNFLFLVL